jgi:outer membrane protein assembly factor BamE
MIKKTLNVITVATVFSMLASCSLVRVYRPDIQQGNVITQKQLQSIHRGMSRRQVINKLGYPVLTNAYRSNQLNYIYSYQPAYGKLTRQYLIISFRNNRVVTIETNMNAPSYTSTTHQKIKSQEIALPKPKK